VTNNSEAVLLKPNARGPPGIMENTMRKTITTAVCTVATIVAVGSWAVASIKADARVSVPAELALQAPDSIELTRGLQLTGRFRDLPAQQFDAI
jgi:hypothetical protein